MSRPYRVVVDGETVGHLLPNETLEIPVEEGPHTVSARIEWCGSPNLTLKFKSQQTLFLECGSNLTNWRVLFALVYIIFFWNDYLWIKRKIPNNTEELDPSLSAFDPIQSPATFAKAKANSIPLKRGRSPRIRTSSTT